MTDLPTLDVVRIKVALDLGRRLLADYSDIWDAADAGLAALVAEQDAAVRERQQMTLTANTLQRLNEEEEARLAAQITKLREFVEHKKDCALLWAIHHDTKLEPDCDCGLDALLVETVDDC